MSISPVGIGIFSNLDVWVSRIGLAEVRHTSSFFRMDMLPDRHPWQPSPGGNPVGLSERTIDGLQCAKAQGRVVDAHAPVDDHRIMENLAAPAAEAVGASTGRMANELGLSATTGCGAAGCFASSRGMTRPLGTL
jgi:hypothetical protein